MRRFRLISRFKGKNVLITGASSGLGEEFARQFHDLGAKVTLVARREDRLINICRQLNGPAEGSADYIPADLTTPAGRKLVIDRLYQRNYEVLINNAGFGSLGYFDQISIEHEVSMIQLNVIATLEIMQAAISQMRKSGAGDVLSVSSIAAFQPIPFMATYAATKGFNLQHSLAVRRELKSLGINISVLCPGPTNTEFFGAAALSGVGKRLRRDESQFVVRQAIECLERKKALVVTGWRSRIMAAASRYLPIPLSSWLMYYLLKSSAAKSAANFR